MNKLGRGLLGDASYQYVSPYIRLCKTCDPQSGSFLVPGHNFNKLGRGSQGDTTYQISRLYAIWF